MVCPHPSSTLTFASGRSANSNPNEFQAYTACLDQAAAVTTKCHSRNSSSLPPSLPSSPVDDVAIMRALNLEMIRESGRGGLVTVYEAKNVTDRLKVALKMANDAHNGIHAVREGQRLRRIKSTRTQF